jgi:valyl-tRNA synthetase
MQIRYLYFQKLGWSCANLPHRECDVLLNVSSHIDVPKETLRITAKIHKLEKELKKLEASLPKSKFSENLTSAVEEKILAAKGELEHLRGQIVFLNSIQNLEK